MKRAAGRMLLFVALGLVTAVLVTWWIAIGVDWRSQPRYDRESGIALLLYDPPDQPTIWTFRPQRSLGVLRISAGNTGPNRPTSVVAERSAFDHEVPAWTAMRRGDPRGFSETSFYLEQGFGWPTLALAQTHRFDGRRHEADGLRLPSDFRRFGPGDWLPLRPIWMGLLANTLFFAWMWFALAAFPGVIIRGGRRWRGLCPHCGYDTRYTQSGVCPECGAAIQN